MEICPGIPCEVYPLGDGLRRFGSASRNNLVNPGDKLSFFCEDEYDMEGSDEVQCLDTGKWDAPFPTCSEKCRIPDIPSTVRITSSVQGNAISKGDTLSFDCRQQDHVMQGSSTSSCLGNGKWSTPPPECTIIPYMEQKKKRGQKKFPNKVLGQDQVYLSAAAAHCSAPPTLENGDTKLFIRSDADYQIGDRVEYICQNKYIMDGDPFKTCDKGVWKGNMRCLKPCTVNKAPQPLKEGSFTSDSGEFVSCVNSAAFR
ncbi:complement receptor type 1-like isoform X3 [Xiphophorus maculatus]|uniref:complement receptor type 1-like isoform X3 n=1 Tax=Xiphophorus maculatus TaxID=8083 RepID=UPI000C6DBD78|nr:complement receptor type 1-like isoform X3 [Xiphophorus maculatus]